MTNHTVRVYLGQPIDDPTERQFLERLREDLARLDVPCLILANFHAGHRQQRQVDFFVVTPWRVMLIELKGYRLPVVATINGPWAQIRPDGSRRPLDVNGYSEATGATFAVSDQIKALAASGELPASCAIVDPKRRFDTVVCMFPDILPGSHIAKNQYVAVLGYVDVLNRLSTRGSRLAWDDDHWDAFIRCLGVYAEDRRSDAERLRAGQELVVDDYRRRFRATHAIGLPPRVPTGVVVDNIVSAVSDMDAVVSIAKAERTAVIVGASGAGKSLLAEQVALRLTQGGTLVIWVRAAEYRAGRLATQLARSVAPFSTESAQDLLAMARVTGCGVTVVLDGFNECAARDRGVLIEELAAFLLRERAAVLITSQMMPQLGEPFLASELRLLPPSDAARVEMFQAHGGSGPTDALDAFRTPFELALAAEVSSVTQPATATALLDAYITRAAGCQEVRAVLGTIAVTMDRLVRSALSLTEVQRALRVPEYDLRPEAIDAALSCPVLAVRQGQVMFRHERFGRFLVADALVVSSTDADALASTLRSATHADLRTVALELEGDPDRVRQELLGLADPDTTIAALDGHCGAAVQAIARAEISALLREVSFATTPGSIEIELVGMFEDRCHGGRVWTAGERAFLVAAGRALPRGQFVEEVAALVGRTDQALAIHVPGMRESGEKAPYSRLVAMAYQMPRCEVGDVPAACIVANEARRGNPPYHGVHGTARLMAGDGVEDSPGRLLLAMFIVSLTADDLGFIPDLVERAWHGAARALRGEVLLLCERAGRCYQDRPDRDRLVAFLEAIEPPTDLMMSTALVEALAAFDLIATDVDLVRVRQTLDTILARPVDEPEACAAAARAVSNQFEEEAIVGPYMEAIDSLTPDDRTRLLVMAARASAGQLVDDWILSALVRKAADPRTHDVLRLRAGAMGQPDLPLQQFDVVGYLHALRGCTAFLQEAPTVDVVGRWLEECERIAWQPFAVIMFSVFAGTDAQEAAKAAADAWRVLTEEMPAGAVNVLVEIASASVMTPDKASSPHPLLLGRFASEVRTILEWALQHRDQLPQAIGGRDRTRYIVETLGMIGTPATADLLRRYVHDPDVGDLAVRAIRRMERAAA
jgi:hypothetical protein